VLPGAIVRKTSMNRYEPWTMVSDSMKRIVSEPMLDGAAVEMGSQGETLRTRNSQCSASWLAPLIQYRESYMAFKVNGLMIEASPPARCSATLRSIVS